MQNVVRTYDYYTLEQAKAIIRAEENQKKEQNKAAILDFVKTLPIRLFSIIMMIVTVLLTLHIDGEFLIAWFIVFPLGLFGTFAKSETLLHGNVISW